MTDIVAFIRARLDEDEAHARKDLWALDRATPGTWQASYGYNLPYSLLTDGNDREIARFVSSAGRLPDGAEDLHAADVLLVGRLVRSARSRAERVLREVAAKRAIPSWVLDRQSPGSTVGDDFWFPVYALAQAWSDHPDFDQAWTVE